MLDADGGPCGIAVDPTDNVYVTYPADALIKKFNSSGVLLFMRSGHIPSWSRNSGPYGVAIWPGGGYFCITDLANGYVQIYTSAGSLFSEYGIGALFNNAEGLVVNSSGDIYVSDYGNNRIYIFLNPAGVSIWNAAGSGNGQLLGPLGLAVDSGDNVYVCDYRNNRIQKFTSGGVYITQWGSQGSGNGEFQGPTGVAVDSAGSFVFVADAFNNRIQKFDLNGNYLLQWGTGGSGNGEFNRPTGVAVDSSGNVYVTDKNNYRIQKFDSNGTYLTQWQ